MRRLTAWLLILLPQGAQAHSPTRGILPFYGGMLHPFVDAAHVMAMLAIGVFIAQQPKQHFRLHLGVFGALVAGVVATGPMGDPDTQPALLALTLLVAVSVAFDRLWLPVLSMAVVSLSAFLVGLGSSPDGLTGGARTLHLAGCICGAFLGHLWTSVIADQARLRWQYVARRVVGSWLAASALLVLTLAVVGPRKGAPERKAGPELRSAGPSAPAAAAPVAR